MTRGTWQGSGTWKTPGGGGGWVVLLVIAAALIGGSGAAVRAVTGLVETIALVFGSVIGLAVLAGIGWMVHRARQDRRARPIAARPVYQLPPDARPRLEAPGRPALEAPRNELHLHFHGMDPAEVADAIRQANREVN